MKENKKKKTKSFSCVILTLSCIAINRTSYSLQLFFFFYTDLWPLILCLYSFELNSTSAFHKANKHNDEPQSKIQTNGFPLDTWEFIINLKNNSNGPVGVFALHES